MQNAFNMEHFKDLQSTAVRALLVAYPGVAVPVITGSIVSGASQADITLGGKLAALSDLILTAHALANHEMKDTFETRVSNKLTAAPTTNNSESASLASSTNSKTRVKRPAKLAQYKALMSGTTTTSSSSVNRFGPVAQLFFQPVLRILMSILRRPLTTAVLIPSVSHASVSNENQRTGLGAVGDDDTDSLLVAQCLLAIGAFVRCSINTRNQR